MKALVQAFLQSRRAQRFRAFERACRDPRRAQEAVLRGLIERSGQTAFARRIGATPNRVRSLDDLRKHVPLTTYDDLAKEIEASLAGAADQLIPGKPPFFAITSGTSGRSKYIPIDAAYRRAFQTPMQHYLYGIVRDHPATFSKKVLYMVGPPEIERAPGGAAVGTISGYNYQNLSPLLKRFGAVPWQVYAIRDPRAQAYVIARLALLHDVSFAVAITTAPLAAMGEAMREHAASILRDISDGTLTVPVGELLDAERASLAPFIAKAPGRARELERRARGELVPRTAWPDLALLSCWAHAGAATHKHLLPALFGDVPMRSAVYSATEGWINVPQKDDDPSGVLAIESGLYELEELDESGAPTGETRLPDEVVAGKSYGIVLSSGCGIFRYRLGDQVRVTGFFHRTPEVAFVQKLGSVLSLAHDLTSESHVRAALASLPGTRIDRWAFGPSEGFPPRYRLAVAGEGIDVASLARDFDAALGRANMGYEADREADILAPLEVVCIARASFDAWDAERRQTVGNQAKPLDFLMTSDAFPREARPTRAA